MCGGDGCGSSGDVGGIGGGSNGGIGAAGAAAAAGGGGGVRDNHRLLEGQEFEEALLHRPWAQRTRQPLSLEGSWVK